MKTVYITSAFNPKTGELISVPLKQKRSTPRAVPTIFSNYPRCYQTTPPVESIPPNEKQEVRENALLQEAISASVKEYEKCIRDGLVKDISDVLRLVKNLGYHK